MTHLAVLPVRVIETADRRVLGAFRLADAVSGLPIGVPAAIDARTATIAGTGGPEEIALPDGAVRIVQNRSAFVLIRAPFFDDYTAAFDVPPVPPTLRLHVRVTDAGPQYLPQRFDVDLPRPLDPAVAGSVFEPQPVVMLRAPGAAISEGAAVLRVSVRQAGPGGAPLGGVLVRVFRSPRAAPDRPLGAGMTEWRGAVRGEALVALSGIERFRPGLGESPIETSQPIEFEITRDTAFTGAAGQLPDVSRLLAGAGAGIVRVVDQPPGPLAIAVRPDERPSAPPAVPVHARAGREYVVQITVP